MGNKNYSQSFYQPLQSSGDPFAGAACSLPTAPVQDIDALSCSTTEAIATSRYNYTVKLLHYATASGAGDTSDTVGLNNSLLDCPRTDYPNDDPPTDLSTCTASAFTGDAFGKDLGWTKLRRAWSSPPNGNWVNYQTPEHMLITKAAASVAGFDNNPLFTNVFWVRYPTLNQFIASPVTPTDFAVGATFVPTRFATAQSHARRAIYLPELSQLPDASYTVWDWAAGNEMCPIAGLDTPGGGPGAFSSTGDTKYDVNNCHDYVRLLGPLNMSHFKPASRAYWTYYHGLALTRMNECTALDAALAPLDQSTVLANELSSQFQTEEQECEREAMVFEMVAQHYLQDNWATGHMWARWGAPDLASIPQDFHNPPGWSSLFPGENTIARQVLHNQLLGVAAGTIHGAKAVLDDFVPSPLGALTDDPLSGPQFPNVQASILVQPSTWLTPDLSVQWRSSNTIANGVGDYFWSPDLSFGKVGLAYTDPDYTEQRKRLLLCSAKSMRDAYLAGPKRHGALDTPSSIGTDPPTAPDDVDLTGDYCWGNWATNQSMAGAPASLYVSRTWFGFGPAWFLSVPMTPFANFITTQVLLNRNLNAVPSSQYSVPWLVALDELLSAAWVTDTIAMSAAFQSQSLNPTGIQSAQLVSPLGQPISMLGVAPNYLIPPTSVGGSSGLQPPTYYADMPSPRPENSNPSDYFVQRMFWRSHLRETCREVDGGVVGTLAQRCQSAASTGGDPDACTACVEAVEPHVPTCGSQGFTLGASKCQALGTNIQSSLPTDWFDSTVRWNGNQVLHCSVPSLVALEYCTGTVGATMEAGQSNGDSAFATFADARDAILSVAQDPVVSQH